MSDLSRAFRLRITIAPYWDAEKLAQTLRPDAVISILGAADRLEPLAFPYMPERAVLRLGFDDVLVDSTRGGLERPTILKAPKPSDMIALAEFLGEFGPGSLLVHCRAGVSRSPAIAMAIADAFGANQEAITSLRFGRSYFKPSKAVLSEWRALKPRSGVDLLAIAAETRPSTPIDPWGPATFELYE
jgi:predicted protein tyrosine phosphatase